MPRTARNDDEIERTRNDILDRALEIIGNDGYDSLTMRKLGERFGSAAKTIYNYYSCKEEIYIRVLTRGFEELNRRAEEVVAAAADPRERLRSLVRTYISFGTENANYYNIMFNWDVPKYRDYVGTILEPIAGEEKRTAFRFAEIAKDTLAALAAGGKEAEGGSRNMADEELTYKILKLWSELHGLVSLFNSRGILEFEVDFSPFVERITGEILELY